MKSIVRTISTIMAIAVLVELSGCNPDDVPPVDVQDLTFEKLSGSWTLGTGGSIKVDNQDVSLNYPGFSLSFADGTYNTVNAGDLFSASGTWSWPGEGAEAINLDDGKELTITALTANIFTFTFSFAGIGGEANGIGGNYEITVVK